MRKSGKRRGRGKEEGADGGSDGLPVPIVARSSVDSISPVYSVNFTQLSF